MKEKSRKDKINNNAKDKLEIFNKKYNTELEYETMIISIPSKNLGDEGFKLLSKIPFNLTNQVIELNLSENFIQDISPLLKMNYTNLKKLNLSKNRIENINIFDKLNVNNLEELNLSSNKIKDVSSLSKLKLDNLTQINLYSNKISDISSFEFMNCPNLRIIDISNNDIIDITVFERMNFPQLNQIACSNNYFNHELIKNNDIISNLRRKGCHINIWGTTKQHLYG